MIKTSTNISNKLGLHARASAKLTKLAGSFGCEVFMSKGERRVNARDLLHPQATERRTIAARRHEPGG